MIVNCRILQLNAAHEPELLAYFLNNSKTGSLVRAADKLNVTQSRGTARLKTLEEELGQVLINRQKSGATLMLAGAKLMRYAPAITGL